MLFGLKCRCLEHRRCVFVLFYLSSLSSFRSFHFDSSLSSSSSSFLFLVGGVALSWFESEVAEEGVTLVALSSPSWRDEEIFSSFTDERETEGVDSEGKDEEDGEGGDWAESSKFLFLFAELLEGRLRASESSEMFVLIEEEEGRGESTTCL